MLLHKIIGDFKILVAGGITDTGATSKVEVIDLETTKSNCSNLPSLPRVGYGSSGFFGYNDTAIICGGYYSKIGHDK